MFLAVYALQFHDSYVDLSLFFCVFFFNDTATTEIYTLSLHDALPICYCTPWVPRSSSLMAGRARGQWRKNGAVKGRGKEAVPHPCSIFAARPGTFIRNSHASAVELVVRTSPVPHMVR